MKKREKKLHIKLTFLYTSIAVLMGIFIIVFGYFVMRNLAVDFYGEKAQHAAALAALYVDGDDMERYVTTMETDEEYEALRSTLNDMKEKQELTYLYLFDPGADSFVYILEAVASHDPEDYVPTALGEIFHYMDIEYTYLVPDVEAKRASQEVIVSNNIYDPVTGIGTGVSAWAPVLDSRGEVAAMVEVDIALTHVLNSIQRSVMAMALAYALMIGLLVLFQSISIRRMITMPLKKLTDRTLAFAAEGKLTDTADDINTGDELQTLSEAFGQMARDIVAYTDEKASVAAVKERISTELGVAGELRKAMLPSTLSSFPGKRYVKLHGQLKMCEQVGGDFYDYFPLDDHRVGIVLGVIQSSGVPAAMLAVVVRTIIKSKFSAERSLEDTMSEINRQIYDAVGGKQPISAFVGVLDTDSGELSYINASYNPPVVMRQGERYEFLVSQAYSSLGVTENVTYRALKLELRQNDRLMFYSDGVVGAKDPAGNTYGAERLRMCLNELRNRDLEPKEMVRGVMSSVEEFMEENRTRDDLVLLTLEYLRGSRDQAQLVLPLDMGRVPVLQEFLKEQLAANQITGKDYAQLLVCGEELFAICCKYAAGGRVGIDCVVPAPEQLTLRFTADLKNGDPLSEDASPVVRNAVAFIRKNADRLELEERQGETTLVMTKSLARAAVSAV